jgi:hypothetical protein
MPTVVVHLVDTLLTVCTAAWARSRAIRWGVPLQCASVPESFSLGRLRLVAKSAQSIGLHGINVDLRLVDGAAFHAPQRPVLKAGTDATVRWTVRRAWHLGQRVRWMARGGNSDGDDCRSDTALIPARSRLAII